MKNGLFVLAVLLMVSTANAAITFDTSPGSGAPPATLGPYTMTPFPPSGLGLFSPVSSLPTPIGGAMGFSPTFDHRTVGSGWATWSHGYTGDVYYSQGSTTSSHSMPAGTGAFYMYIEPNPFSAQTFTVTDSSGASSGSFIGHGSSGAAYVGQYATGGQSVGTLSVTGTTDYAIGTFAIAAVPEPASLGLLALGGLAVIRRRR